MKIDRYYVLGISDDSKNIIKDNEIGYFCKSSDVEKLEEYSNTLENRVDKLLDEKLSLEVENKSLREALIKKCLKQRVIRKKESKWSEE